MSRGLYDVPFPTRGFRIERRPFQRCDNGRPPCSLPLMRAIQNYVIELLTEVLGEAPQVEARFPWALGDVSARTGRAVQLPFDAVWEARKLVVEVDEDQHQRPVSFFDKPEILTVSGVHRGEQRRIYDLRKRAAAKQAGYRVVEIPWPRSPAPARRDRNADREMLRGLLKEGGVVAVR